MVLALNSQLETALNEQARREGTTPEALALEVLSQRFIQPQSDQLTDWQQRLRAVASDCGVSLSDEAVSSEGIYE